MHDFSAIGSEDNCIEKIEELVKAGAKHISIRNLGTDIQSTLDTFSRKIIPQFSED